MSKLSKLLIISSGVAVANYYTKNPNKLEEHTNILKQKAKDSYGYTRCMVKYAQKNGVTEAVNYLFNDIKKIASKTKDNIEEKYNKTVEYGKELSNNVSEIKDHVVDMKDYSKDFKNNISVAKGVVEEIKPTLDSFVKNTQSTVNSIKNQFHNIKTEVYDSNVQEKVEQFSNNSTETINQVKEKVQTEVFNNKTEKE
ncbi:hypothetical protein [Gemella cuniculi]|uniref:hypothetical protein n=1 Tax=Gemella cuniculi TaxID=150240 RepID=UPI0004254E07|nr:hypothetical protein [Gemella cuniculi]